MLISTQKGITVGIRHTEMSAAAELRQEQLLLKNRLEAIREGLDQVQKENSLLKMKSTIALGQVRLQVESMENDKQ